MQNDIKTPSWEPPIVQLGSCQFGYMFGFPTFNLLFRDRGSNINWQGYPGNAPCYETLEETLKNQITDELGIYCPQIYGFETFEELEKVFT
jgi:hypothetical protein